MRPLYSHPGVRSTRRIADHLRSTGFLPRARDRELKSIAALGQKKEFAPGTPLTTRGTVGREFFILLSGEADCLLDNGDRVLLHPGDYFGEMALLDGLPRTADVRAATVVSVLVYGPDSFAALLERSPGLRQRMMGALADRLRAANVSRSA